MEVSSDLTPFQEALTAALVKTTKSSSQLLAEDIAFQRSINPTLSNSLDEQSDRFLNLTNSLLQLATSSSDLNPPSLEDEDDLEENWRSVVDVIDELLEKADACLDEFTGIIKKLNPSQEDRGQDSSRRTFGTRFPHVYDRASRKLPKPQLLFENRPNNHDSSPFQPILQSKPHAIVPLSQSLGRQDDEDDMTPYGHPYAHEIKNYQFPPTTYNKAEPEMYTPFESTTATFVNTLEGVREMLNELKSAKEIAVDLEHNDTHSYIGLVCLMQISTREKDWIVDTLQPWRQQLQMLNEVFADPGILKVLHGSSMDIIWLQRDLGLYVVGLFDTFHAASALHFPKKSLKFLLEKFVNFKADKKYQMADWRVRPLLPEMFDYARSDTHYLLYIYDHLRNELLQMSTPEENLMDYVLDKSKGEALQQYQRPVYDAETGKGPGGWYDALSRTPGFLGREQLSVFRAVHQWRDQTARTDDEGVQSVLPNRALLAVSETMPSALQILLNITNPVSPSVKKRASELLKVIQKAKAEGSNGPELYEILKSGAEKSRDVSIIEKSPPSEEEQVPLVTEELPKTSVRSLNSQFWGQTLLPTETCNSSVHAPLAAADTLALSLPLPSCPMDVTDEPITADPENNPPIATPAAATPSKTEDQSPTNQIFTVKQFGAPPKRKAAHALDENSPPESSPGQDILQPNSSTTTTASGGGGSIKVKKQKKPKPNPEIAPTPFDYANAESLLQTQKPASASAGTGTGKAQFNPYENALDAPHALRKPKKVLDGGRSLTFRK